MSVIELKMLGLRLFALCLFLGAVQGIIKQPQGSFDLLVLVSGNCLSIALLWMIAYRCKP